MIAAFEGNRNEKRIVVVYSVHGRKPKHEQAAHNNIGAALADLMGMEFGGDFEPKRQYAGRLYFLPTDTLVGIERAKELGIHNEQDLYGGVVPYPFMATKAITHPLLDAGSRAPHGWVSAFADRIRDAVLKGFTAFTVESARRAGERLLERGPARVKSVRGSGGLGQYKVETRAELVDALEQIKPEEIEVYGVVLEEHLEDVRTYSVGQTRIGETVATYYGTQQLTQDNRGAAVYGGSDLVVVKGGFDRLKQLSLPDEIQIAVDQGQVYDAAANALFPGFFASRRNYDIAVGTDVTGRLKSAVLEQSWRTGGASSAEMAALQILRQRDAPEVVRASTIERFGEGQSAPSAARLIFSGEEATIGFISKWVMVSAYDDPK